MQTIDVLMNNLLRTNVTLIICLHTIIIMFPAKRFEVIDHNSHIMFNMSTMDNENRETCQRFAKISLFINIVY